MELIVLPGSSVRAVYDEAIDVAALSWLSIARASRVEPDGSGRWHADLSPISGPVLGPFERRSQALEAELAWLEVHWLNRPDDRDTSSHD